MATTLRAQSREIKRLVANLHEATNAIYHVAEKNIAQADDPDDEITAAVRDRRRAKMAALIVEIKAKAAAFPDGDLATWDPGADDE